LRPESRACYRGCTARRIFAFGLERSGHSAEKEASGKLLGDVIAGRRLDQALARAVEAWAVTAERAGGAERVDPVWDRLVWAFGAERERLLARQKLLVRRPARQAVVARGA
jgi:hypothetical protein